MANEDSVRRGAAAPLHVELGIVAGVIAVLLAVRLLQPWLQAYFPPAAPLTTCEAPASELSTRIVYIDRRGADVVAQCGPLVGGRGAFKAKAAK